jgi:hypothetical protein
MAITLSRTVHWRFPLGLSRCAGWLAAGKRARPRPSATPCAPKMIQRPPAYEDAPWEIHSLEECEVPALLAAEVEHANAKTNETNTAHTRGPSALDWVSREWLSGCQVPGEERVPQTADLGTGSPAYSQGRRCGLHLRGAHLHRSLPSRSEWSGKVCRLERRSGKVCGRA